MKSVIAGAITPEDLDPGFERRMQGFISRAVLLRELHAAGGVAPWAELRQKMPKTSHWEQAESLVRLHAEGRVQADKIDGKTFVSLPIGAAT